MNGGSISIGGVDIKDIPKAQLNDMIAYVFQNNKLLKLSIRENLKLAKPGATEEEIKRALHLAQCDDIIAKLSFGRRDAAYSYRKGAPKRRTYSYPR